MTPRLMIHTISHERDFSNYLESC